MLELYSKCYFVTDERLRNCRAFWAKLLSHPLYQQRSHLEITAAGLTTISLSLHSKGVISADKGGGLVILPRTLYNSGVFRHLQNSTCFKVLTSDPTIQFQRDFFFFFIWYI